MYEKPKVMRFGTVRELTLSGCINTSDGLMAVGGVATGSDPIPGTNTFVCFERMS